MNKIILGSIGFVLLSVPVCAFAATCSTDGATIVYVNGIETTKQEADDDVALLGKKFLAYGGSSDVQIIAGYNPSHLDGIGDEIESISQAFGEPISDYDLDTVLIQVAPEVTTRKILLLGHSQGTFYTNEMYDYLVKNGAPPGSIGVYNLATPADHVEGGGMYLTSANDKVINYVRQLDAQWNAPPALPANIIVPEETGYANNVWGGHVPEIYLNGAPQRVVSDIERSLSKLSAAEPDDSGTCFEAPSQGIPYDIQKVMFTVADPTITNVDYALTDARNTISSVADNANDILHTAFSDLFFSIIPKPSVQSAAGAFAVEKALYGSSLSVEDYEALLQGEDIPEVRPSGDTPTRSESVAQKVVTLKSVPDTQARETPQTATTTESEVPATTTAASASIPVSISIPVSPGFGGGSAPIVAAGPATLDPAPDEQNAGSPEASSSSDDVLSTAPEISGDAAQQNATTTLPFSITSPQDQTAFSTSSVLFSGTTSPSAVVFASYGATSTSTPADAGGDWSFVFSLPESTTTVSLSAADLAGDYSATSTLTIGVALPHAQPVSAATCPNFEGGGYFFDATYIQAEYVSGLLRVHLRLSPPYNDGRLFHATAIINGSNCTSLSPKFGFSAPQTSLPAGLQYYSFRMSSATHWVLWDDEHDVQIACDACEGDIPADALAVSFAAMIDSGASTLTTPPYPPTSP